MGAFRQEGGLVQKPTPPAIKQHVNPNTCWAAALSSWLKVARDVDWTQDDIYDYFSRYGYCNESGLREHSLGDVLGTSPIRMRHEKVNKAYLDFDYFYDKLRESWVYLVTSKDGVAHAVVVYAVIRDSAGASDVRVMDPIYGRTLRGSLEGFLHERLKGDAYVGWVNYRYDM